MTLEALLADLRRLKIDLRVEGADLVVRWPKGTKTPVLSAALAENKPGLLALGSTWMFTVTPAKETKLSKLEEANNPCRIAHSPSASAAACASNNGDRDKDEKAGTTPSTLDAASEPRR